MALSAPIRHAHNGGVAIAYTTAGDGDLDVLVIERRQASPRGARQSKNQRTPRTPTSNKTTMTTRTVTHMPRRCRFRAALSVVSGGGGGLGLRLTETLARRSGTDCAGGRRVWAELTLAA